MENYFQKAVKPTIGTKESEPNRKRNKSDSETDFVVPADPGLRPPICSYHPNDRDKIRREYLQAGPRQPILLDFPQSPFGEKQRRFNKVWYNEYPSWLEYSIQKDAAYCLYCYLFKPENQQGGGDAFTTTGFRYWKNKTYLDDHVGRLNSSHHLAQRKCQDLMKQEQSIQTIFEAQSKCVINAYRIRLNASVNCIRFLLRQGLPFRGHDETEYSKNRGLFLELLRFLADQNAEIGGVVLQNAPGNLKLVAPDIQKDIVHAAAVETTNKIIAELGDDLFSILVDESRGVSCKEQMAVILRLLTKLLKMDKDSLGLEKNEDSNSKLAYERFLGIVHVSDTTASSLKAALEELFCKHCLSFSRLRGQGYDGASNMRGEFNGLKALILRENNSAYYVHCFAHQLQLVLVAVAKKHLRIAHLFNWTTIIQNTVGASCKRRDKLREKRAAEIKEASDDGTLSTGRGLNQETSLARPGDTRWSSHYNSLVSFVLMFGYVIQVLRDIVDHGEDSNQRANASNAIEAITTFDFVFSCFFMKKVLSITHELSQTLQRMEQDITNAMSLVAIAKGRLQELRDSGWDSLLAEIHYFCLSHKIDVLNMNEMWVAERSQRGVEAMTNRHCYEVDFFYAVIDVVLQELRNRFTEGNTELLRCMSCLHPSNNFGAFDKVKLIELAKFYPNDFSMRELCILEAQLECYIHDLQNDEQFSHLKGMGDLAKMLVQKKKNELYPLVYRLIKLVLILPVATASVERMFSAMNIIKTRLRNRMGDQWMNDNLVTYIEKDVFNSVSNETIMQRFQNMKTRKGLLLLLE